MEIITRKNELFNLAATFIYENGNVIRPEIAIVPKGLFEKCDSFIDFVDNDALIGQLRNRKVKAESVEELEVLLDQEEQRLNELLLSQSDEVIVQ